MMYLGSQADEQLSIHLKNQRRKFVSLHKHIMMTYEASKLKEIVKSKLYDKNVVSVNDDKSNEHNNV